MPFGRDFQDSKGLIGRPQRGPRNQASFSADSPSRSLSLASRDAKLQRKMQCQVRQDGYLIIDTSQIINDQKIQVAKSVAIKLAKWILIQYEESDAGTNSQDSGTSKTDVVRKSKGHKRLSSSATKG